MIYERTINTCNFEAIHILIFSSVNTHMNGISRLLRCILATSIDSSGLLAALFIYAEQAPTYSITTVARFTYIRPIIRKVNSDVAGPSDFFTCGSSCNECNCNTIGMFCRAFMYSRTF